MTRAKFDPRLLDDIARVAGGAVNIVSGLQQQFREDMKSRVDDFANRADLVPREDMERAEAMIQKLRSRVDDLESRLDVLEGKKKPAAAQKKVTVKKSAPKGKKKK